MERKKVISRTGLRVSRLYTDLSMLEVDAKAALGRTDEDDFSYQDQKRIDDMKRSIMDLEKDIDEFENDIEQQIQEFSRNMQIELANKRREIQGLRQELLRDRPS